MMMKDGQDSEEEACLTGTNGLQDMGDSWYRLLFNHVSDAVFVHYGPDERNLPGKFIEVNDVACRRLGYTREELLQMSPPDIDAPETVPMVPAMMERLFRDKQAIWEGTHIGKDGRRIPVEINNVLFYLNDKPLILATVRDITERKQAEETLLKSEENFRRSLDESALGVRIVTEEGETIYANREFLDIHGYDSIKELKTTPVEQRYTPESYTGFQIRREKRKRGVDVPSKYTIDIIRKTGEVRHLQVYRKEILWNGERQYQVIYQDITERKQAEDAVRQSEERYRNILENIQEGYFELDLAGNYTFANEANCRFLGYTKDELVGMNFRQHTDEENVKKLYQPYYELYRTGKLIESLEVESIRKDGTKMIYDTSVSLIRDNEGKPIGFRAISRDITDRKQAEEEKRKMEERLQRSEKMEALGTLAGGVAHDLNNVLGVIVGYSELLLNEVDSLSPIRPRLTKIMNGSEKAAAIVQDLLTLARRGVPGIKVLNLNKVVLDYQNSPELEKLSSYHLAVQNKLDLESNLLNISGSSVHLGMVLSNLVSNAVEAMPKGGDLTIKTANQYLDKPIYGYDQVREGDYVVLSVTDTGEGIQSADLQRIFEPFYTKKVMGRSGTGLGLAVVWGTVRDHQGYINVQSEEGKGSTFTLYFPVTREDITVEAAAVSISEYMGKGETILVVDDVRDQRDLAIGMLRKLNYNVSIVSSGEEAIEYLKEHTVDLLVLDMIMDPGMDGLDTYRSILEIHTKQKAIIVSGFSESDRVRTAQALGAGAYVKKPYVIEKLGLAVRKELDRSA
jgi:PAS domain S-box-containing protein